MSSVWLVSEGSYSDYRIVAAFTNEDDALGCSKVDEDLEVEEFTLYDGPVAPVRGFTARVTNYQRHYDTDPAGEVVVSEWVEWPWDARPDDYDSLHKESFFNTTGSRVLTVRRVDVDRERAIKRAADDFAALMVKHNLSLHVEQPLPAHLRLTATTN